MNTHKIKEGSYFKNPVERWIIICCVMILLMTWWGGITRLTKSGLSITEWNIVYGVMLPTNEEDWVTEKLKYEATPEYRIKNPEITLKDFKKIYLIEYSHRMLGRIIFLVLLLPYIFFTYTGKIRCKKDHIYFIAIILAVMLQGLFGWYMVKSGLNVDPEVSPMLLSLHLSTALILFLCLWYKVAPAYQPNAQSNKFMWFLVILTLLQISMGALNSGLKSGLIYNTFPLMNGEIIPENLRFSLEDPGFMQFLHRVLAFILLLTSCFIVLTYYRNSVGFFLLFLLSCQICLGALTVLTSAYTPIASTHQVTAFLLIAHQISMLKQKKPKT